MKSSSVSRNECSMCKSANPGPYNVMWAAPLQRFSRLLSICLVVACGRIPILPTRVISVLGLKSTLENPQIQVYFAGNGLLAGENGWPFRRFCGGGGGLPAPLLAPRALILRTKQRLDALSRPTPPYFGHA